MNVTRREVQTRRVEYVVPVPCHAKDLQDAMTWALNDLRDTGRMICDDTISVTADDENFILSFPISAVTDEGGEAEEAPPDEPTLLDDYVWCDKYDRVHANTLNPEGYVEDGMQDYCQHWQHHQVYRS